MEETAVYVHRRGFNVYDTKLFCQFANIEHYAKLDILTAVTLKISVFWDVMLYSLVDFVPNRQRKLLPVSSTPVEEAAGSSVTFLMSCTLHVFSFLPFPPGSLKWTKQCTRLSTESVK